MTVRLQPHAPAPSVLSFPCIFRSLLIPTPPLQGTQLETEAGWPPPWETGQDLGRQVLLTPGFLRGTQPAPSFSVTCSISPSPSPGASNTPPGCGQIREALQVAGSLGETQSG